MTPSPIGLDRTVRFGTRGSALALAQTNLALKRFHAAYPNQATEVRVVRTEGDVDKTSPLTEIGGRGVFTNAIEQEILTGGLDAAVHSAKDLPTALHVAAPIVAFPERDDPRDVLVSRHHTTLDALPSNPIIGTSSRRREALIRRLRPDARIAEIRGNVDTRLRKSEGPEFDGIVIAAAGVLRMGLGAHVSEYFDVEQFVPSPGQGAIAIQAKAGSDAAAMLAGIDDTRVSMPVRLERAFLAAVGAGCTMPVGAFVTSHAKGFRLIAMLADPTGSEIAFANEPLALGDETRHVAEIAARLLSEIDVPPGVRVWNGWSDRAGDLSGARVVVTRPRRQAGQLMTALAGRGALPVSLPTIRVEPVADTSALDAALKAAACAEFDWIAFTSANAVNVVASRLAELEIAISDFTAVSVAAIGAATALAARDVGLNVACVPQSATAESLATELLAKGGPIARVLYPKSAIGRDALPDVLRGAGALVLAIDAYRTLPEPDIDPKVLDQIRRGEIDAITFASPSSVRNFLALLGDDRSTVATIPAICAGPVTAAAAREAGLFVAAVSADPGAAAMADALAAHWNERADGARPLRDGRLMRVEHATEGSVR